MKYIIEHTERLYQTKCRKYTSELLTEDLKKRLLVETVTELATMNEINSGSFDVESVCTQEEQCDDEKVR